MDDNNFMSGFYAGRDANNNNDGFGGGNGFGWIWILLIFAVFAGGWGGFGFGGGMGGGQGAAANYVLNSDFATLQRQLSDGFGSEERKLDSITNGLCDGFYTSAQLAHNTDMAMANGFAQAELARANQQAATMAQLNAMQMQAQQCCCDQRAAIADVNYNMATHAAGINNAISTGLCGLSREVERGFCDSGYRDATNTNAIMQNAHNDADRILARIDKMESDRQAERIAQLTADNNALRFQISQDRQTADVVDKLGYHCPVSAYVVQPPQQVTFPTNCCGGVNYASAGGCGCMG